MSAPAKVLAKVPTVARAKLSGYRILIVEDEMIIALGLMDIVAGLGASWAVASRVAKAVALAAAEPFDAAILDMNLAGEPTYAVADILRLRGIPVVISTGYGSEGIAERYRDLPRLPKPHMSEHVEAVLLHVLKIPRGDAMIALHANTAPQAPSWS